MRHELDDLIVFCSLVLTCLCGELTTLGSNKYAPNHAAYVNKF